MPYNTSAIPPPEEVTGQSALPLARVKRIINTDEDVNGCASNAAFLITVATEMFIQYLAEQGHNVVKSERKPRKNIQYRDLANAVARIDNLEFLSDVIPRTVPYKQVKNSKQPKERVNDDSVERGQTTLDRKKRRSDGGRTSDSTLDFAAVEDEDDSARGQGHRLSLEIRGPRSNGAPKQGAKPSNRTPESDEEME